METLTRIEIEFMRLCCTELTYKEIAVHLGTNFGNVDRIRNKLFRQTQCVSRIGLVLFAINAGIYSPQEFHSFTKA